MAGVGYTGRGPCPPSTAVSRRRKNPLRPLTDVEQNHLRRLSRSAAAPAAHAAVLPAVAQGLDCRQAARAAGRTSGDAVSNSVARFSRILREANRVPTPAADGTATWSLTLLRQALRAAPTA